MSIILVHGVPDTGHLWQPLIAALERQDILAPTWPGFGTQPRKHFDCGMDSYAAWLIAQVQTQHSLTGPVHLVGHDWGGLLTLRVAHLRPDLIASWTVLNASLYPDLKWHRLARTWQAPIKGEIAMMLLRGRRGKAMLRRAGMPERLLQDEWPQINTTMKKSILRLYRSAVDIGPRWGADLSGLSNRGLVIGAEGDPFVPVRVSRALAERADVPLHLVDGGHWAVHSHAEEIAPALIAHWAL